MIKTIISITLASILFLSGCTKNDLARNFGGTQTINCPKGKKVVNVTWKEADIWILYRDMKENEKPETLQFSEKSCFGQLEGTVILVESN